VRTETEVLECLAGVLGTSQEDGVGTSWRALRKLVECEALTTSGGNASAGGGGESEGSDRKLGNLDETVVIGHSSDDDNGLALLLLAGVLVCCGGNNAGDRDGRPIDLAHKETAEDSCIELGVGTTCINYSQP